MAQVLQHNIRGREIAPPIPLDRRRRRLSTICARYANRSRPYRVSVLRGPVPIIENDEDIKLRREWKHTLVGPSDSVLITYLPLGGGGGGGSRTKQVGAAVAMIALAVAAPYAAAAMLPAGIAPIVGASAVAGGGFILRKGAS
jgi:hypothetical protein